MNMITRVTILSALIGTIWSVAVSASQLGDITDFRRDGNAVVVSCGTPKVRIEIWDDDVVRVWLSNDGRFSYYDDHNKDYSLYMIQPGLERFHGLRKMIVADKGDYHLITTASLAVRVEKKPFRLLFYKADNRTLITCNPRGDTLDTDFKASFDRDAAGPTEHFYGLTGPRQVKLDKRGETVVTREGNGHGWVAGFFMSTAGYGIFLHNEFAGRNRFTMTDPVTIECGIPPRPKGRNRDLPINKPLPFFGQLDFFFFYGPGFGQIIDKFTDVTGKPPMPPKKLLGFNCCSRGGPRIWQSNIRDFESLRDAGYPVDNSISFVNNLFNDKNRNVAPTVQHLREHHGAAVAYFDVHPYNGSGPGSFSDIKPEDLTYPHDDWKVFKAALHRRLFSKGVQWLWIDEIDSYHESYQFQMMRAVAQAMEAEDARRGYMCSRGGNIGCQRWGYPWMGDVGYDQTTIKDNLQNGLVGVAHATHDMGGYPTPRNKTAFLNGVKVNLLNPITQLNNWRGGHMPADHGPEGEAVFHRYLKLHYALLPYWYTMAWEAHTSGLPDWRALVVDYGDDPNVYDTDEFMVGPWLLCAPLYAADTRDVYLPRGRWIAYFGGKTYTGPTRLRDFSCRGDEYPLFVKAGAIIPMGPDMLYVDQKPTDPMTLDIYPHGASEYEIYEDDGKTRAYRKGTYALTAIACRRTREAVTVTVGPPCGKYDPGARTIVLKVFQQAPPAKVSLNAAVLKEINSADEFATASTGWACFPDKLTGTPRVRVKFASPRTPATVRIETAPLRGMR